MSQELDTFFYAQREATSYDATVRLAERPYDMVHELTSELVRAHFNRMTGVAGHSAILDVGCGTGEEAIRLLNAVEGVAVVCVDRSNEMLDVFRSKVLKRTGSVDAGGRLIFVNADVCDDGWPQKVYDALPQPTTFVVGVSVYALHHLGPESKVRLYRAICSLVSAGGLFINSDLYSYSSRWLASLSQDHEEAWIRNSFQSENAWEKPTLRESAHRRSELMNEWLRHIRTQNRPLPVFSDGSEPGAITESSLLFEAGFRSVECAFRLFQAGIVMASK
jgi:SAM-dependent methyltransferase